MESDLQLNSRQQQVLQATIRHYIATAEPVGSRVLNPGVQPEGESGDGA